MWSALAACHFCLCERIQQIVVLMGPRTTMVVDYLEDSWGREVIFEEGGEHQGVGALLMSVMRNFSEEASIKESGRCWEEKVNFKESRCRGVSFYQDRRMNLAPNS